MSGKDQIDEHTHKGGITLEDVAAEAIMSHAALSLNIKESNEGDGNI